jgi:hypothetical protein
LRKDIKKARIEIGQKMITKSDTNLKYPSLAYSILILIILYSLNFSIYGSDGYDLWYPISAEYLNGDRYYNSSGIIFNGQNLAAIYGKLPFWTLLRLSNPSINQFLNVTHGVWILSFFML